MNKFDFISVLVSIVVIVLNWWMLFSWHARTEWTFEALLVLVAWAWWMLLSVLVWSLAVRRHLGQ